MRITIDTEWLRPSTLAGLAYDLDDVEVQTEEPLNVQEVLDARNAVMAELVSSEGLQAACKQVLES